MNYQAANEGARSEERRKREGFFDRYIVDKKVLDVGHGGSPIAEHADGFELDDGDATLLGKLDDGQYDTVYASHILEHLDDPETALQNWWRVLKLEGHLIFTIPDEDLYERGIWPSVSNPDHRTSWTISKTKSWSKVSKNVMDLLLALEPRKVISIRTCDEGYDPNDQSVGERQIEVIVQKQGFVHKENSSLSGKVACPCGSRALQLLGFFRSGNAWLRCQDCGQRTALQTITILQNMGIIEPTNGQA